jgi:hypothetical protein
MSSSPPSIGLLVIAAIAGGFETRERFERAFARSGIADCAPGGLGRGLSAAGEETPIVRDGLERFQGGARKIVKEGR